MKFSVHNSMPNLYMHNKNLCLNLKKIIRQLIDHFYGSYNEMGNTKHIQQKRIYCQPPSFNDMALWPLIFLLKSFKFTLIFTSQYPFESDVITSDTSVDSLSFLYRRFNFNLVLFHCPHKSSRFFGLYLSGSQNKTSRVFTSGSAFCMCFLLEL